MNQAYKKHLKGIILRFRAGKMWRRIPKRVRSQQKRKGAIITANMKRLLSGGKGYTPEEFAVYLREQRKAAGMKRR